MTIHDTFAGAQYATSIAHMAEDLGMRLEVGSDFNEYAQIIADHRPEQPLGDPYNPELHDIREEDSFWMTGWNEQGQLVHTQAMRRFAIVSSLAEYLEANFRAFPPSGLPLDMERSRYIPGPGARQIRGELVYHGEAWLKPGDSTYRGTGISGALARFAMASAVLRWSPDYIFAFVPEKYAFRGLVEREGYMHSDPGALIWQMKGENKAFRGFMVWMGREDLTHMMGIPPELLVA